NLAVASKPRGWKARGGAMAQMLSIDDWVERLAAIPAREFTLERVQAFLAAHGVKPETLEPYLFFSKGNYTRNLIFKYDLLEFIQRAVSVHVYSKPFDSCEIYSREKGTYFDVSLHYTSEYGRLNPEEKLL